MSVKPTISRVCQKCHREFLARASEVAEGKGKYCSRACHFAPSPTVMNPDGITAQVPLCDRRGKVRTYAIVDACDAERVGMYCWSLTDGYAANRQVGKLHRFVLGLAPFDPQRVDHADRDRLNCRRVNLRFATHGDNMQNKANYRGSVSQFRGVTWTQSRNQWRARVQINGKRIDIGFFDSEEKAGVAAREARLRMMPYATD